MNDLAHPNTELCKHCGRIVVKVHAPLRLDDSCPRCKGHGMVDIINDNCGHFTGSVVCEDCCGSGRRQDKFAGGPNSELDRIRDNDHA